MFNFDVGGSKQPSVQRPSVRYIDVSKGVEVITTKTTVLLVTRNGTIKGRFDIAGQEPGKHVLLYCLDGSAFRQHLFAYGKVGKTEVEIFRPDGSSWTYIFRGGDE